MNKEKFYKELKLKKINLASKQKEQLDKYYNLVKEWNKKINLTSITEEDEFYKKHFYDSIAVSFYFDFSSVKNLCDVGSGAGFPSIPLKIVFPHLNITIADSLNKRIKFLKLLSEELQLENCEFIHTRAEELGQNENYREKFDLVTARAVARLNVLTELCMPLVKKNGYFLSLKSKKAKEEILEAKKSIEVLGGILESDEEFLIDDEKRHILRIKKIKNTPKKYPRKSGVPNKSPIGEKSN